MTARRVRLVRSRPVAMLASAAVLLALAGGFVRPAAADGPVLVADTLPSGAATATGSNGMGQTNPQAVGTNQLTPVALPSGTAAGPLTDAVSVASGTGFVVWADKYGKVWSLGDNGSGQKGNGSTGGSATSPALANCFGGAPGCPSGQGPVKAVKVAAAGSFVDVLDDAGDVWQWGQVVNSSAGLSVQSTPSKVPFPSGTTQIVDIAVGASFSLAMDSTYRLYSWGKNDRGQLGTGTNNTSPYPTQVQTGTGKLPYPLAAGESATFDAGADFGVYTVTRSTGVDVYTWGRGDLNELGNGKTSDSRSPGKVATVAGTVRVLGLSAGLSHTLLLTQVTSPSSAPVVWTWGTAGTTDSSFATPTAYSAGALSGLAATGVEAGDGASFVVGTGGTVVAWGTNSTGQLGNGTTATLSPPATVPQLGPTATSPTGVPVQLVSRNGATYLIRDAEVASTPEQSGHAFGTFPVNPLPQQTPPSATFVFRNTSDKPLVLSSSAAVEGTGSGDFVVSGSTCTSSTTVPVDGTCQVKVTFAPSDPSTGTRSVLLVLRFSNTRLGTPWTYSVPLSGTSTTQTVGITNYSVSYDGSPGTLTGRGNRIPLTNLAPSLIPDVVPAQGVAAQQSAALPAVATANLAKTNLAKVNLAKVNLAKVDLASANLAKVNLAKVNLAKVNLAKVNLAKVNLAKVNLAKTNLAKVPLLALGGWQAFVADYPTLASRPVSTLTLQDLVNTPATATAAAPLDRLTLGDIDLAHSVLADVSAVGLLWGGVPLASYPEDWCAELTPFENPPVCTGDGLQRSLFSLSLGQGYPVESFKANALTVGQIRAAAPAGTDPLAPAVWPQILLRSTTLKGTHLDLSLQSLADAGVLGNVVSCSSASPQPAGTINCANLAGRSLGDPDVVQATKPDAVFNDLGSALNPIEVAWFVEPFLDRGAFNWEDLPRSSIPLQAYPNRLALRAKFDVNCLQVSNTTLGFTLPSGYDVVPGTTALLTTAGGTTSLADPKAAGGGRVVVSVPDSMFGAAGSGKPITCGGYSEHVEVTLGVLPPFRASPSQRTGGDVATGSLTASGQTSAVATTGAYPEPGVDTIPSTTVNSDELVLGTIGKADETNYIPFDVPAGKTVEVTLSQLHSDLDLVLYHPQGAKPDALLAGTAQPVPFGEAPVNDGTTDRGGGATQDVPILPLLGQSTDRQVAAVSALRGTQDEQVSTIARQGVNSTYLAQVTGFYGATGDYTLRVRTTDAQSLGPCTVTPPPAAAPATSLFYAPAGSPAVTGFAPGDTTAVLVNTGRLRQYFPSDAQSVLDAAYQFTHSGTGSPGQVIQVDSDPGVQAKMAALDASPCSPEAANDLGRAITSLVQPLLGSGIKYLVLTGGQEIFSHFFPVDTTRDGNEREEGTDLALTGSNLLANAFANGRYATDAPYGTLRPLSVLGQVVYPPNIAVGRLGETPAQIIAQLSTYQQYGGVADPNPSRTAVVTDYDFLTRGGNEVASALTPDYTVDHTLTGQTATWTRSDLDSHWLLSNPIPSLAVLNMHYDQYRGLPAFGNATNDQTDLYTTAEVAGTPAQSLLRRVVLTIGCHSGTDIPDDYAPAGDPRTLDWAQEYAAKSLAAMVGNLGFGYADSSSTAFSALQQVLLTKNLVRHMDLGTALAYAQRTYVSTLTSVSPYDLKAMQEMVLWGLPMWRTTSNPAVFPTNPGIVPTVTEPLSGLQVRRVDVGTASSPVQFRTVSDGTSTHVEARVDSSSAWDAAVVNGRPTLPRIVLPQPDVSGMRLAGSYPVALTSAADETGVTSTFGTAGTDHAHDQDAGALGHYPVRYDHTWNVPGSSTLVVTPESVHLRQTTSTGAPAPLGYSDRNAITASTYELVYVPTSAPVAAPDTILEADGVTVPGSNGNPTVTSFLARVRPASGTHTVRVFALVRPIGGAGAFDRVEMSPNGVTGEYVGGLTKAAGAFYVVVVNSGGGVSVATYSGQGNYPHVVTNGGTLSGISISPAAGSTGWRTTTTTATCQTGWTLYVDGAQVACPYTFPEGLHVVTAKGPDGQFVTVSNGDKAFVTVLVDTVQPTLSVSVPNAGAPVTADANRLHVELRSSQPVQESVTCGASGCAVTDNGVALGSGRGLSTSTVNAQSFTASVTNGAGVTATVTRAYRVVFGAGSAFATSGTGVVVLPILPVRFVYRITDATGGTAGPGYSSGTTEAFTASTSCSSNGSFTLPSGSSPTSSPSYNSSTGNYEWDLSAATLSGCQQLDIGLPDGWTHLYEPVQVGAPGPS